MAESSGLPLLSARTGAVASAMLMLVLSSNQERPGATLGLLRLLKLRRLGATAGVRWQEKPAGPHHWPNWSAARGSGRLDSLSTALLAAIAIIERLVGG